MENFFEWLFEQYQKDKIEIHILFNGVDYDRNFYYNTHTKVLTADSATSSTNAFGSEGKTFADYVNSGDIQMKLIFKK